MKIFYSLLKDQSAYYHGYTQLNSTGEQVLQGFVFLASKALLQTKTIDGDDH
jgi:hypothetical protein